MNEHQPSVARLSRDLVRAATTLSDQEVRFLVDQYYVAQEARKRSNNQVRAMDEAAEPHALIGWLADQSETLEAQIKRALEAYVEGHPVGQWMMAVYGIGPVISAGLLAHIDINQAPTAGHIWSFAGMDPGKKWEKGQKRPWNARLKVLAWKAGQSFMKFGNAEDCVYGKVYQSRKEFEVARNESGGNAETVARDLEANRYGKSTDAYKALKSGKLPQAQIDARARRYAVKLFLSHLQTVWWFIHHGVLPPAPYGIAVKGHAHFIPVPHVESVPGLAEALRSKGWQ